MQNWLTNFIFIVRKLARLLKKSMNATKNAFHI